MKHLCKPLIIACLLVALCGLLCLSASAEYFEVDYYDEIAPGVRCGANLECSTREDTVVVTICNVKATATDIVIPSTLSYNGNNYKVSELRLAYYDVLSGFNGTFSVPEELRTIHGNLFNYAQTSSEDRNIGFSGENYVVNNTTISVPDTQAVLAAIPGFIKNNYVNGAYYAGKCLVRVDPNYEGDFTVKEGTVCVLASAFEGCDKLGAVTLPDSIEFIGVRAFANSSVTSVNLPVGLIGHSDEIFDYTFYNCKKLRSVAFGEGVTLKRVAPYAFMDCSALKGFDLPKVGYLDYFSFAGAFDPAANVEISMRPDQLGCGMVFPRSGIKKVTFLDNLVEPGNTSIPYCNFYNCPELDTIILSTSVGTLNAFCFEDCEKLTSDILAQENCAVTYLGYRCLAGTRMTEVTIPASVESSDAAVFADNPELTTLNWYTTAHLNSNLFVVLNDCYDGGSECYDSSCVASSLSPTYAKQPEKNGHTFITTLNMYAPLSGTWAGAYFRQPYLETVNIHNSADTTVDITYLMFQFCPALSEVNFDHPEKIGRIESYAFSFCPSLHSFPFEEMTGLTYIGADAFMLDSMSDLNDKGYSNSEVEGWAEDDPRRNYGLTGELDFTACTSLNCITSGAFQMQYHITSVKLSEKINISNQGGVFCGCSSLKTLEADCPVNYLGDGSLGQNFTVKLSRDDYADSFGNSLMSDYPPYNDVIETLTLNHTGSFPTNSGFFTRMLGLKNVTLKEAPTVPGNTFTQCISLETVNLPDTTTLGGDSYPVFCWCGDFELNAPNVTTVQQYALRCNGLKSISLPSATTFEDSDQPFCRDTELESISLPSLTTVGQYFFSDFSEYGNANLPKLRKVELPNVVTVSNEAFFETALEEISLPKATNIGAYAFFRSPNLKTVSAPKATTLETGAYGNGMAFAYCPALEEVSLPSLQAVEKYSFFQSKLRTISLPGLTTIVDEAFFESGFEEIDLPEVTNVGSYAFFKSQNLKTVSMPKVVSFEGSMTFAECTALENVELGNSFTSLPSFAFASTGLKSFTLPAGNNAVYGRNLFNGCSSLESLTVAEGVKELGWFMCAGCESLSQVSLPSTLETISWGAFKDCPKLTGIKIPASVTLIDDDAFAMSEDEVFYSPKTREGTLSIVLYGAPTIKNYTALEELSERDAYLEKGSYSVDVYNAIVALLPIPDGSVILCESESDAYNAAAAYKESSAPSLTIKEPSYATVKADDASIYLGYDDPEFTATVTGLAEGDSLVYTFSREPGNEVGSYTISPNGCDVQGDYIVSYETGTLVVRARPRPSGDSSSGSSSSDKDSGGSKTDTTTNNDGSKTEVKENADGSKVETTTRTDGSKTETTTAKDGSAVTENTASDGSTGTVKADAQGNTVSAEAKVSEKAVEEAVKAGESVKVQVEVKAATSAVNAAPISVNMPKTDRPVKVEIPVENVTAGTVAVIVHEDGTEEIVKTSTTSENGVELALSGSATVKIVDNTKTFDDVKSSDWFSDNVAWAASHEIMNGVGDGKFNANADTSRGMIAQLLFNLDGAEASGDTAAFSDVSASDWFAGSVTWMVDSGIAKGQGESFGANDPVSREQLAVMLYNYAQYKGYDVSTTGDVSAFKDAGSVSDYAKEALAWAVGVGLINGTTDAEGNIILDSHGSATRAQVAAITQRFCEKVAK